MAALDHCQPTATQLPAPYKPRSTIGTLARFLKLGWRRDSFLHSTGLWRSYRENRPVDGDGQPLPWFNYGLIHLLDERLRPAHRVFEYGSGYSTLYFAARVANVTSVEHDSGWLNILRASLPANAELIECAAGTRYHAAAETSAVSASGFDIVLVDGLDRELCLPHAARALSPGGVIILDDSHRSAYAAAVQELSDLGFRQLRWFGPKPNALIEAQSLLLYRSDNVLGL
ncbi:MAG: hypothetical protein AAGG11_20940 [Pseudomonadota bacterium]